MSDLNLQLRIRANDDGTATVLNATSAGLNRVRDGARGASQQMREMDMSARAVSTAMQSMAGLAGAALGGFSVAEVLNTNRAMQSLRTSLDTVVGGAANAQVAFSSIQSFAASTPYTVQQVTDSFIKLKALGLDPSEKALTSYGNTASAMGKDLNQMIEAVADASTGEFERLKEFGIKSKAQGDNVAFTFQGVTTEVKNSAADIQGYLQKIGDVNFAGGMEKQAKTINGALSNLGDSWDNFLDHILNTNSENAIAKWVASASEALGRLDIYINGATATKDKIFEIDKQIDAAQKSIAANQNNGMLGGLIDGLAGYDVNAKKNEIDGLLKKRAELVGTMRDEQAAMTKITQGYGQNAGAAKALDKVSQDKIAIEERYEIALKSSYKQQLLNAAAAQKVNSNTMLTLAALETNSGTMPKNYGDNWRSSAGAMGLMQVMPAMANALSARTGLTPQQILNDQQANIKASAALVKEIENQLKAAGHLTIENVAAAYNAGMPALMAAGYDIRRMSQETINYASNAGKLMSRIQGTGDVAGADKYEKTASALNKAKEVTFEAVTAVEIYTAAITKASAQLATHEISQDGYNQKINDANDKLMSAVESTGAYKDSLKSAQEQQEQWNLSISQANALYDNLKQSLDTADFAAGLKDLGFGASEIKGMLDQYKSTNDAIASNPNLSPAVVVEYTQKRMDAEKQIAEATKAAVQDSSDFTSKAWGRAIENIQDALGNAIEGALNGKGMKSFTDFAGSIKDVLYKAVSQSISAGIIDSFKNKDWGGLFNGLLAVGASALISMFTKSAPVLTSSASQINNSSTQYGSGAQAISDSVGRPIGYDFQLKTTVLFNNALADARGALTTIKDGIYESIQSFGTKLLNMPMLQSIKSFFSPLTNALSGAWDAAKGFFSGIADKAATWFSGLFTSTASAVSGGLNSASAASGQSVSAMGGQIAKLAGQAMAVIGAVYSVYSYFSDIGTLIDMGNVQLIVGNTLAMVGSVVAGVSAGLYAAAGAAASTGYGAIIGAVLAVVGALVSAFTKVRVPNTWLATRDAVGAATDSATWQDTSGNKSAAIGGNSRLGWTTFSSHELNGVDKQSVIESFRPILDTILTVDNRFAATLDNLDMQFGQAGETMRRYNEIISKRANYLGSNQKTADLDVGKMVDDRYRGIIEIMRRTGTMAGVQVAAWYDMFSSKFSDAAKKSNPGYSLSLIQALSSKPENGIGFAEMLLSLPKNAMQVINESIQALKADNPFKDLMTQAGGIIVSYMQTKLAFGAMGDFNSNEEQIMGFIGRLAQVGIAADVASGSLIAYAKTLVGSTDALAKGLSSAVFDSLGKVLDDLKSRGLGKEQLSGYLSTFTLSAGLASDAGIKVSTQQLGILANGLNDAALAATKNANEMINHAIADNKLGSMAHDAAVQELVLSGKIKDTDVAAANFGIALTKVQQTMIDGFDLASRTASMFFTNLGAIGISFESLTGLGANLTATFGDVGKAASWLDGILKTVYSPKEYALGSQNAAQASFNSASSGAGFGGLTIEDFRKNFAAGLREYFVLAGSANEQDKARATQLKNLMDAGANLITANKALDDALGASKDVFKGTAEEYNKLIEQFKGVNDAFALLGKSPMQQSIDAIERDFKRYNELATDTLKTGVPLDVVQGQINRNADVAMDQLAKIFDGVNDAFKAIGKTDLQKSADKIRGDLKALDDAVDYAFSLTDKSPAWQSLRDAQKANNLAVALDAGKALFNPLLQEFLKIGKTVDQINLDSINLWFIDTAKSVNDIAQTYGITTTEALAGIEAIRKARVDALNEEYRKAQMSAAQDALKASVDAQIKLLQDAASAAEKVMQSKTDLLNRSFDAEKQSISDAYNAQVETLNKNLTDMNTKVSDFQSLLQSLDGVIDSIKINTAAAAQNEYARAKSLLSQTLNAAKGGDFSGAKNALDKLGALSSDNAKYFKTAVDYTREQQLNKNALSQLKNLTDSQLTDAQKAVKLAEDQLATMKTNNEAQLKALDDLRDKTLGVDKSVVSVQQAIDDYNKSKSAYDTAKFNAENEQFTKMYNTTVGIHDAVLSIADAIANYNKAKSATIAGSDVVPPVSGTLTTSAYAAPVTASGLSPVAFTTEPVKAVSNDLLNRFDSLMTTGLALKSQNAFKAAAELALENGFSKSQIADYVASKFGIASGDTLEFMRLQGFAKGGISHVPAIFAEAGPEAAVPLPDGRSIPVRFTNSQGGDSGELVQEIKALRAYMERVESQNQQLQFQLVVNTKKLADLAQKDDAIGTPPVRTN
jgi:hypothetical protein